MALTLVGTIKRQSPVRGERGRFVSTRPTPIKRMPRKSHKRGKPIGCLWSYCQAFIDATEELYCRKHAKLIDEQLATQALFKPWTVVCWLCSARRDESWTPKAKELWVKSGWLRCDQCGSRTVGVEAFDARDDDKEKCVQDVALPHVRLVH